MADGGQRKENCQFLEQDLRFRDRHGPCNRRGLNNGSAAPRSGARIAMPLATGARGDSRGVRLVRPGSRLFWPRNSHESGRAICDQSGGDRLKERPEDYLRGGIIPARKRPSHMPPGFTAVTPYLTVDDPDELLDFAKAAFDAEEVKDQRAVGPDGKLMHTAFCVEGASSRLAAPPVRGKRFRRAYTS